MLNKTGFKHNISDVMFPSFIQKRVLGTITGTLFKLEKYNYILPLRLSKSEASLVLAYSQGGRPWLKWLTKINN